MAIVGSGIDLSLVSGLVLAGGQGQRMQAIAAKGAKVTKAATSTKRVEKGLLLLHGKPLVQWAISAMPKGLSQIYISANQCLEEYKQFASVVTDDPSFTSYSGPLAGIASVLKLVQTPWLLVAPTDVPQPPAGLFNYLLSYALTNKENNRLFYINTPSGLQPLFCLVHKSMLPSLLEVLNSGENKVRVWLQAHGQSCMFNAGDNDFFNINTPTDLQRAHSLIN